MAQSPDKTRIGPPQTIVEASGVVWSLRSDTMILRAASATAAPVVMNARASEMVLAGGIVYAHNTVPPKHWWKVTKVNANGSVNWADAGVNDPASSVIPPPPPPPPPGASPDGTMVPPAASITLASGVVLTLGAVYATDPPNRDLLRNGVAVDRGVLIEWKRGFIWNHYSNHGVLEWWKSLDGTNSVRAAPGETPDNPAPYAPPVKSFPPTLAVSVGVPVSLLQYVSSALPLVFDPVDDADKTITAAGVFTAKRVVTAGTATSAYDDGH